MVGGVFIAAAIILVVRRRQEGVQMFANSRPVEEELVKRLEMIDRGLRDEFSRNREEAGTAAKAQREELGKSLEGVRELSIFA